MICALESVSLIRFGTMESSASATCVPQCEAVDLPWHICAPDLASNGTFAESIKICVGTGHEVKGGIVPIVEMPSSDDVWPIIVTIFRTSAKPPIRLLYVSAYR